MDPNTARAVLRLDPAVPLTPEAVEQSYSREAWERHPSRYPDAEGRASAEAWAVQLADARAALLASIGAPTAPVAPIGQPAVTGAAGPASTRRGLSRGAVIGIVAGSVALLALLTAVGFGAAHLATTALEQARVAAEEEADRSGGGTAPGGAADDGFDAAEPDAESPGVERFDADEMYFTFPAALELYDDGRYSHLCGLEHLEGCWESALFAEEDCTTLEIDLGFSNEDSAWAPAEETRTVTERDAVAGEALPVVYGNDGFAFGWIEDVRCTTARS